MEPLSYVSLCAGIDAASIAWQPLGFQLKAVAEIEPFPCAVLAERQGASRPEFMPQVEDGDSAEVAAEKRAAIRAVAKLDAVGKIPNRGDFTTIMGDEYGAVDLMAAGTPCQDFSVAGLRAGMDGKRGQLTVEFAKLAHRMAAKARTRWIVWENVPGVLSIDEGWAFAEFLGILTKRPVRVPDGGWANFGIIPGADDGFGLVYGILDAQHFGVPQRRRRVFVVGYFGDWRRAAAVLLERHSLSGDFPPRREKGQAVAGSLTSRASGGGGGPAAGTDEAAAGYLQAVTWPADVAPTLDSHFGDKQGLEDQHIRGGRVSSSTGEIAHCLNAGGMGRQDFETETLLAVGGFFDDAVAPPLTGNPYGDHESREGLLVTHSLRGEGFDASEDGTGRGTPLVAVAHQDIMPCMTNGADTPAGHSARSGDTKDAYIVPVMTLAIRGREGEPTLEVREDGIANAVLTPNGGRGGIGVGAIAYRTAGDGCVYEEGDQTAPLNTATDPSASIIIFDTTQVTSKTNRSNPQSGDPCHTHAKGANAPAVCFEPRYYADGRLRPGGAPSETVSTLKHSPKAGDTAPHVATGMAVRRLTPVECSRLQGFPDNYLDINFNGKPAADGPKYKALGNSMAVPCMAWIGKRIQMVESLVQS